MNVKIYINMNGFQDKATYNLTYNIYIHNTLALYVYKKVHISTYYKYLYRFVKTIPISYA